MRNTVLNLVIHACIYVAATVFSTPAFSAQSDQEYTIKAAFIGKFTQFIDWPEKNLASDSTGSFNICVVGNNPFGNKLDRLAVATEIKGKNIRVFYLEPEQQISHCHVVFIPKLSTPQLNSLLSRVNQHPILTIADSPGYASRGVMINFYRKNGFIGFEINKSASDRSHFEISSRLLKLAVIIDTHGENP